MKVTNVGIDELMVVLLKLKKQNISYIDIAIELSENLDENNKLILHPIKFKDEEVNKSLEDLIEKDLEESTIIDPEINTEDNSIFLMFDSYKDTNQKPESDV